MTLKTIVSAVAPFLGNVIGSVSPVAGIAYNLICKAFGLPTGSSEDVLSTAIQNDPDAAVKLKQIETEHLDVLTQASKDVQLAAYSREVAIVEKTGRSDWILYLLATIFTMGFFSYLSLEFFDPKIFKDSTWHDLLNVLVLIYSYFYGASHTNQGHT